MDEQTRNERILNPPFMVVQCEGCGGYHHENYYGECRNDAERFNDEQLNARFGEGGWLEQWLCVTYQCSCGHEWQEEYSCACDSDCSECGAKDVEASAWEQIL